MPLTEEYQMPFGLSDCFAAGLETLFGGVPDADAERVAALRRAGVISKLKGVKPPVCEPTVVPFTQTSVFQSGGADVGAGRGRRATRPEP